MEDLPNLYFHTIFTFFFQAEDGIRDADVTGVRRVLFRFRLVGLRVVGGLVGARLRCLGRGRGGLGRGSLRSEERRVGKEGGSWGGRCDEGKKRGRRRRRAADWSSAEHGGAGGAHRKGGGR